MGQIFGWSLPQLDWKEIQGFISAIGFVIFATALLIGAIRVTKITTALKAFREARGEVSQLLDAIASLEVLAPKIKAAVSDFGEDIQDLRASGRAQEAAVDIAGPHPQVPNQVNDEERWQKIRMIWRSVRDDLEKIVADLDGRVRRPYNKILRNSYAELISKLKEDDHLSEEQANAASNMNQRFLQLRPHPASATADDAQNFETWKKTFAGQ